MVWKVFAAAGTVSVGSNAKPKSDSLYVDPTSRMFIMTILAFMWSGAFAVYLGSITYFGLSVAAHIVLILMFFFTVAIFYDAEKNNSSWLLKLRKDNS